MIVYSILNQHNGKRYIGFASRGLRQRRNRHLNDLKKNRHKNAHLQSAWNRGDRYLLWITLEVCSTLAELKVAEKKWIAYYKSDNRDYGYNKTSGGDGGAMSLEIRQKMSDSHKGKPSPRKGKTLSPEQRMRISQSQLGKKRGEYSPEHRNAISVSLTGRRLSQESRNKISMSVQNQPRGFHGRYIKGVS